MSKFEKITLIDLNITTEKKLIRSEILTLYKWNKIDTNKISTTKKQLQVEVKKYNTNFNRDCENLDRKTKAKIFYDEKLKKINCQIHQKQNKNFVQFPSAILEFELVCKNDKTKNIINQCIIDVLFAYRRISLNKRKIKFYSIAQIQEILNKMLKKICGKTARQYTYEEVRKANKYLEIHKIIKTRKNKSFKKNNFNTGFIKPVTIIFDPKKLTELKIKNFGEKLSTIKNKNDPSWKEIMKNIEGEL